MIINGNLKFHTVGDGELQNAVMERMDETTRNALAAVAGQIIYNTTSKKYNFYNGTSWEEFGTGGNVGTLQTEVDAIESALDVLNGDGTFKASQFSSFSNVSTPTTLLDALTQLDAAISAADTLAEMTDVNLTSLADNNLLQYNATSSKWVNVPATSIGEFGFKTFNGDTGSTVADTLGDTIGLVGATNGGVTTIAEDTGDTVSFSVTPVDLATTSATLDGTDFLIVSDSDDAADTVGQKTTISKMIQDLNIVTAAADGMLVRTADDTYASRTLTVATTGLEGVSITNANGVAGDPVIGLDVNGLTAEAGTLSNTDTFVVFDGTNNVKVTLQQVSDGIVASSAMALDDLSDVTITAGANNDFLIFDSGTSQWIDVDNATSRTKMDVYSKGESDTKFVDVAGDTMTGNLTFGGTKTVTNLAAPTNGTDATTKNYVDSKIAGLTWKNSARVATTTGLNIDLTAGLLVVDGLTLVNGDRVLVKNQTNAAENGVYIASDSGWTRASDFDSVSPIDEINSAAIFVESGGTQADTGWTVTSSVNVVNTDPILFTQFTGASNITAGTGLTNSGNILSVLLGAGIADLPTGEVGVDLHSDGGLALTDTLNGSDSTDAAAKLQVKLDGSTLSTSTTGLKVASSGITATEINSNVAGDGLTGGSGTALSVDPKVGSGLVITSGQLDLTSVPNTALANSSLTIAADSGTSEVADLGETVTLAGGTGIDSVVSATNTVTFNLNAGIDTLTDVDTSTTAPVDGEALVWDAAGSKWVPGETSVLEIEDLTNVSTTTASNGQILVSDNSGNYTPRKVQHIEAVGTAATTWTVNHNLNQKFVNVTVYDATDNMIIPQSVVLTDANTTTITFNTNIAGTAVIMGIQGA